MSKEPGSVSYHSGKLVLNLTHFYNMQHMHLENGFIKSFLSPWASTHLTGLLVRETRRDSNTRRRFSPFRSALRTSATKFWGVSRSLCLAWNKGIQMKLLSWPLYQIVKNTENFSQLLLVNFFVQFRHHYMTNTIKSWGNNIINQEGLITYQYYCKPSFIRLWEIFVRFQELRIFLTVDLYWLSSCNTKTGVDKACSRKLIAMSQFILCKSLKKVVNNSWFIISTNMFQWFNHQL